MFPPLLKLKIQQVMLCIKIYIHHCRLEAVKQGRNIYDNIKKAILFGSYAKGFAREQSDIDLLVDSGLKGLAFFGLLEDIVTSLGKNVDLLDVSQLTPDSLVGEEIKKNGVVIYEQ